MTNIWTQHLEKTNSSKRYRELSFTGMLHSLVKAELKSGYDEGQMFIIQNEGSSAGFPYIAEQEMDIVSRDSSREFTWPENDIANDNFAEKRVAAWEAKSQRGHELGISSQDKDNVRLLMAEGGRLFLRYEVAGENPFEMNVRSEDEAMQIIDEDNQTTGQLYPDNPELKWIKISLI